MTAQELLVQISDYCRQTGLAESTFGRRAVNDGKLAARLRNGGRITTETVDRVRAFIAGHRLRPANRHLAIIERTRALRPEAALQEPGLPTAAAQAKDPQRNFRFFDNRQKYLLFVNTCSEKWVIANRV